MRAGTLFAGVGMPEIAEDEPPTIDDLRGAEALLVAVDGTDRVLGYARIDLVDGHTHLEQLSVDPEHGRRGIGGALLEAVTRFAQGRGDAQVTLTTFRDVPFNRPYYERHGYVVLAPAECGPGLVERIAHEAENGLDPTTRAPMRRLITTEVRPGAGGTRRPGR